MNVKIGEVFVKQSKFEVRLIYFNTSRNKYNNSRECRIRGVAFFSGRLKYPSKKKLCFISTCPTFNLKVKSIYRHYFCCNDNVFIDEK